MDEGDLRLEPERLTEGVWQIDTETSTYVYDVDRSLVTRLPGGAGSLTREEIPRPDLRRDSEPVTVLRATPPVVGRPWYLRVVVQDDGGWTVRRTTAVCHVVRLA